MHPVEWAYFPFPISAVGQLKPGSGHLLLYNRHVESFKVMSYQLQN